MMWLFLKIPEAFQMEIYKPTLMPLLSGIDCYEMMEIFHWLAVSTQSEKY